MKEFAPAKRHIEVSVGESVRTLRELQELSQNELAGISGIPQSTILAIENDRYSGQTCGPTSITTGSSGYCAGN